MIDNNGAVLNKTEFNKTENFKHKLLLKENNNFGDFPLERDDNYNKTLLKSLDIESDDWFQFLSFLN